MLAIFSLVGLIVLTLVAFSIGSAFLNFLVSIVSGF